MNGAEVPTGWNKVKVTSVLQRVKNLPSSVATSDFLSQGAVPIVDQGKELVSGFTNDPRYQITCPPSGYLVFGDHTRVVKFINFNFATGADGTQVLESKILADVRFITYSIQSHRIPNTGYNRHFKLLAELELLLPGIDEQVAIAKLLGDIDTLIDSLNALIAKKRDIKQGAMQQLLTGKTRLPGFVGEWIPQRLGDLATMSSGGTPPSKIKEFYGGNIKWASIADMTRSGKFLSKTDEHLTELGLINSSAAIYKSPVVLYAMYASLGEVCICLEEVSSSQAILGIVPGGKLELEFLYYLLLAYKPIVKSLGQQGTQSNLHKRMVQEIVFPVPANKLEQRAIAEVLSDMDAEINALVARREKTALIKIGMMQELLTGRTRLI